MGFDQTGLGGPTDTWDLGPKSPALDVPSDRVQTLYHFNRPFVSIVRIVADWEDSKITFILSTEAVSAVRVGCGLWGRTRMPDGPGQWTNFRYIRR